MGSLPDPILRPVLRQIAKALGVPAFEVEEALSSPAETAQLHAFLLSDGPSRLLFYRRRAGERANGAANGHANGENAEKDGVYIANAEDPLLGRGVALLKALSASNVDSELAVQVLIGSPFKTLHATLSQMFMPLLGADKVPRLAPSLSQPHLTAHLGDGAATSELPGAMAKFAETLGEALSSLEGGVELERPEGWADVENKPAAFSRVRM